MLGERIKSLRNAIDKTQAEVSKDLGVSRAAYSHIENNRNEPDGELLGKIADYYNVTTDYLLGRNVPDWASTKDVTDLERVLKLNDDLEYRGEKLSNEDRQQLLRVIEAIFWEQREEKRD